MIKGFGDQIYILERCPWIHVKEGLHKKKSSPETQTSSPRWQSEYHPLTNAHWSNQANTKGKILYYCWKSEKGAIHIP